MEINENDIDEIKYLYFKRARKLEEIERHFKGKYTYQQLLFITRRIKAITKYMSVFLYITFFFLLLIYCKAVIRINKNNIIIKLIIMTITSLYYYITKTSIYLKTLALFYTFNKYIDKLRIDANRTHKRYGIWRSPAFLSIL